MAMLRAVLSVIMIGNAFCYITPSSKSPRAMVALSAKSKSVPFLQQPAALTGDSLIAFDEDILAPRLATAPINLTFIDF